MNSLNWVESFTSETHRKKLLGGKAYNLVEMTRQGLSVPEFGVVTTEAFAYWQSHGVLPEDTVSFIKNSVKKWGATYVAVRSSMSAEDGVDSSYAGMMETFLYVPISSVEEMIIKCFESAQSGRVKLYEEKKGIDEKQQAAVVVQKMVDSYSSGVSFSRAPLGDSSFVYIEAGLGLGEGVVSGLVEVDRFYLNRIGETIKADISEKLTKIAYNEEGSNAENIKTQDVPKALRSRPCLNNQELEELCVKTLELEKSFKGPVDIEWAFERSESGHKLYLLQVRPITQAFSPLKFFIDTNLSESYPGFSKPLSSDIISMAYTKVFNEAFAFLGVGPRKLKKLSPYLNGLVTNIGGHMYYALDSYYAVLATLPGGKKNIDNWHKMIGGNISGQVDLDDIPISGHMDNAKASLGIVKLFAFHQKVFSEFYESAQAQAAELDQRLEKVNSPEEGARLALWSLDNVRGFGLTALNDLLIMISIKALTSQLSRMGHDESILPDLIKTEEGVESLRPLDSLKKLCLDIHNIQDFLKDFESYLEESYTVCEEKRFDFIFSSLESHGHKQSIKLVRSYLQEFGDRAFEELKLEQPSFDQSPKDFLDLLRFQSRGQVFGVSSEKSSGDESINIDEFFSRSSFVERKILKTIVSTCQKTIAVREHTRLIRGKFYGRLRKILLETFYKMRDQRPEAYNVLCSGNFFNLNLIDIESIASGQYDTKSLIKKMSEEKYRPQSEYPEFLCRDEKDSVPYFLDDSFKNDSVVEGEIKGLGASSGKVTGKALVLIRPQDALSEKDLSDRILITRNTDPAWVFIMGQCAGLVSEKGSLLSHTAIIGRELGIPTVVGVPGAMKSIENGAMICLNADTGVITEC